MKIAASEPLARHSSLRTGGPAYFFAEVDSIKELSVVIDEAKKKSLPFVVVGEGTNVLFSDHGFIGYVIRPKIMGIGISDDGLLVAGAGERWDDVVALSVAENFSGIENLAWIPGSAGAAPIQNIGAYGVEIKDVLEWVEVFDSSTGTQKTLQRDECAFGYRDSFFKTSAGKELIVIRIALRLVKNGPVNILYKDLQNYFAVTPISIQTSASAPKSTPTIAEVREAVIKIRQAKLPDIAKIGTAGSFFKNPIVSNETHRMLLEKFPDLPSFSVDDSYKKIPLAWILDKVCGLNGVRDGFVGLYETQPLALVNFGGATSTDIKNFAKKISDTVREKTNLDIEWEVNFI